MCDCEAPVEQTDDDASLIARCRAGDGQAWRTLVQRYQRLVHAVVMRAGLDTHVAADVFQTVFTRLLDHLPRLADPSRLRAWIVTTARREAWRQSGQARRWVSLQPHDRAEGLEGEHAVDLDMPDTAEQPDEAIEHLQQLELLRRALEHMDERCQRLLPEVFSDEDRPDYAGIASRLGMPIGSIGPTRARCLDKLRGVLAQQH